MKQGTVSRGAGTEAGFALVYRMLKWGHEYVDKGLQYYEERHRQQQVQLIKKRAAKLGLHIVEPEAA